MDRFYAPHTPEALAFQYLSENLFHWDAFDTEHSSLQERLMAGCSAYQALARYLAADDVYIPPRSRRDLERILYVAPRVVIVPTGADKPRVRQHSLLD
jgi:hypothetical protein